MQPNICLENIHRTMHFSLKQMLLKSSMVLLHSQLGHLFLFFGYTSGCLKEKNLKNINSIFFLQRNKKIQSLLSAHLSSLKPISGLINLVFNYIFILKTNTLKYLEALG